VPRCVVAPGIAYEPHAIAVDDVNVYWSRTGDNGTTAAVMRTPRRGGPSVVLAQDYVESNLVTDGSFVYWADGASVVRVPVAGGSPVTLATAGDIACLALDEDKVYWTAYTPPTLASVPKMGGDVTTLSSTQSATGVFTGPLAVSANNLYWLNMGYTLVGESEGGGAIAQVADVPQLQETSCRSLAIAGSSILMPAFNGGVAIASVPLSGALPAQPTYLTANADAGGPYALVADSTNVYYLNVTTALEVDRVPLTGGAVTTLALPQAQTAYDIALASDGTVFFSTNLDIESVKP
jgi:hypothetical protein